MTDPDWMTRAMDDMWRAWVDAAKGWTPYTGPLAAATAAAVPRTLAGGVARDDMARIHIACVESGFRYLTRWAEVSMKYYPAMVQAMMGDGATAAARTSKMGTMVDRYRAYMREMAELPLDESRRLQSEIERIVRSGSGPTSGPSAGRGRAKAKSPKRPRHRRPA